MEEIPRKHDNNSSNKNRKTLPVAINVGGLGIGGIVLFGGALITATIVSALAFKRRSQRRRSTSENMNKTMSSSPSDEVTSMKEIHTKNIQSLTPDKKHDYGMDNEDIIDSVVVQDQENTSIRVDSAVECIEEDSCLERDDDGGEAHKHLMLIDDEHVDANSLFFDEDVMWIEEYEAIEDEDEDDHQGRVFMNEEAAVMEGVCMNHVKVEDSLHDEIVLDNCEGDLSVLDNCEGDLSDDAGYADQIVHEVVMEEEEEEEASRSINKEAEDEETAVEEQVTIEDEAEKVDDQTDNSPRKLMSKDEKDEIPHVEFVKEEQDGEKDVTIKVEPSFGVGSFSMQEEPTPEAKISNHKTEETVVQVKVGMLTDHKLVKKDEIPHVGSTKEDEDREATVMVKVELSSGVTSSSTQEKLSPESKITNHKIEEITVQANVEMIIDHELVKKDEIPYVEYVEEDEDNVEDVAVKAELESGVSSSSMQEELTPETKISNKIEETDVQVKVEMVIDRELVNKDEIPHVESVKEDEDSKKDVMVKAELGSDASYASMQEEPTQKAKTSNHKNEENMKEDQTILGKNHNDSDDNEVIKEQAFTSEPWNLKLMAWFVLILVCCLLGSLSIVLILLGYHNRATNFVKYE